MNSYEFHPAANIFPLADGPELEALAEDIRLNGKIDPIILLDDQILDGRRRYLACQKAKIDPKFRAWQPTGTPLDFVISLNRHRRHLNPSQVAVAALKMLPILVTEAKDRQKLSEGRGKKGAKTCAASKGKASAIAAKQMRCCPRSVEKAKAVQNARPDLIEQVEAGSLSLSKAYATVQCAARGLDCTATPPSVCYWIWLQLQKLDFAPNCILDPCAGTGNLTKPFTDADSSIRVIEFEIQRGTDFLSHADSIECDLVVCNPPFGEWFEFLKQIVARVGSRTPVVFICPQDAVLGFKNTKDGWHKWLCTEDSPKLNATTPLPKGSFIEALSASVVLWFNILDISDVGMVPPEFLVARHDWQPPAAHVDLPHAEAEMAESSIPAERPIFVAESFAPRLAATERSVTEALDEPQSNTPVERPLRIAAVPEGFEPKVTLHHGDSLAVMKTLPSDSVDCCTTSVPYYLLRDYGYEGQYGLEDSVDEWVENQVNVFAEVQRALKPTGTCWINVGDTYAYGTGSFNSNGRKKLWTGKIAVARRKMDANRTVHSKSLMFAPHRLAIALAETGWICRSEIVLEKNVVDGCDDRPTRSHEYLFLFTKTEDYHFDADSLRVPYSEKTAARGCSSSPRCRSSEAQRPEYETHPLGKLRGTVWQTGRATGAGDHPAPMPLQVAADCVRAGCPENGTVLDPFVGSGTTAVVCQEHRRHCIGIDLSREYLELACKRVPGATIVSHDATGPNGSEVSL